MKKILKSPYDLVSEALDVKDDSINDESAMGKHYAWDSINHLHVIVTLEKYYEIIIPNEDFTKYTNMTSIIELYERLSGGQIVEKKGFLNRVKSFLVGKVTDK